MEEQTKTNILQETSSGIVLGEIQIISPDRTLEDIVSIIKQLLTDEDVKKYLDIIKMKSKFGGSYLG